MGKDKYKPNVTNRNWLYSTLKLWFFPGVWFFFRRRTYNGKENLLPNKPLFLIPNHQNAFMDATSFIPVRFTWQFAFLMRAGSFKNKMAAKFLYGLNMLPIYRQMDGADLQDSNDEVFKNCAWLMERRRTIICYAEGTHSLIRRIRPIKKGPLRFAFAAEEKNNWTLDVHFVPVGMNYSDRENFGGDYLANIGKPIRLADYKDLYKENPARAINELKKAIERDMEKLAVHIPSEEYYAEIEQLRDMAINDFARDPENHSNQVTEFEKGSEAIAKAEKMFANAARAHAVKEKLARYKAMIDQENLRDVVFAPAYRFVSPVLHMLFFILLFPVFVVGYMLHIIPAMLTVGLARKVVKDPAFNSSIMWAGGTVIFSLFYVVIFLVVGFVTGNWWYALLSWPAAFVTAMVTLWYKRRWNKFSAENRFRKFTRTTQGQQAISLRKEIMQELYAA